MAIRYSSYLMTDGRTLLNQEYFNTIWTDLDSRLDRLENLDISWSAAIAEVSAFGLERIDILVTPVVSDAQAALTAAQALYDGLQEQIAEIDIQGQIDTSLEAHDEAIAEALQEQTETVNSALSGVAIPSGAIIIWLGNACPAGWSRATELDGLYIKGAATGQNPNLTPAGSNTHVHDLGSHTHTMAHTHDLGSHTHGMSHNHDLGSHTHTFTTNSDGGSSRVDQGFSGGSASAYGHTHGGTTNAATGNTGTYGGNTSAASGNTGSASDSTTSSASGNTGSTSNEPQRVTVLFCKKA